MRKLTVFVICMAIAVLSVSSEANAFLMGKKNVDFTRTQGTITNIDLRKSLVTVALNDGTNSTFMIEDKTSFEKKGNKIGLSDLKKGDLVKVDYFVKKGQNRAHAINVDELAASKPKLISSKRKK